MENPSEQKIYKKKDKPYKYLKKFEKKIEEAKSDSFGNSRIKRKLNSGTAQIAKKMGEEAVEMVIAANKPENDEFLGEAADVFYYYLLALHDRGFELKDVLNVLKNR